MSLAAPQPKVVVITGCSSGIGLSLALQLASDPTYKVVATLRNVAKTPEALTSSNATVKALDVSSTTSVQSVISEVMQEEGRIDVLVNNAGYGALGPVEMQSLEEHQRVFDVNYFGVVRMMQAIIPHMRKARSGHIINVSSIGGIIGQPINDAYCASKFAVEGLSEASAACLACFNVKVTLINPGPVATNFVETATGNSQELLSAPPDGPYTPIIEAYKKYMDDAFSDPERLQSSDECAAFIKSVMEDPHPHMRNLTSDVMTKFAGVKLADTTGDASLNMVVKRVFGSIINEI
eukprot:jgi/Chrzof1/8864/Cz03g27070.t1